MILIHVWSLPKRYVHKTGINRELGIKCGLKPIAYLKKWMKNKEDEVPQYLTGKKKTDE